MFSKARFRLACWLLCGLLGWGLAWGSASFGQALRAQNVPLAYLSANAQTSEALAEQALLSYRSGRLHEAIALWQSALQDYKRAGNLTEQARIWNYLAMTYGLLGQWTEAKAAIAKSLHLIPNPSLPEEQAVRAQALNIEGIMALELGRPRIALKRWQAAAQLNRLARNRAGVFRSRINQARALQALGLFPLACQQLLEDLDVGTTGCDRLDLDTLALALNREATPFNGDRLQAWLALARGLRQVGQVDASDYVLERLLAASKIENAEGEIWLNFAENSAARRDYSTALADWQKAMASPLRPQQRVEAQLAQLGIWIQQEQWNEVRASLPPLWQDLQQLPVSQTRIFAHINLIHQLIPLLESPALKLPIPPFEELAERLQQVRQEALAIGNRKGESYALGTLGNLYRQQEQWAIAQSLTQEALVLAESMPAPELAYLWQWQLARIQSAQGDRQGAIAAYLAAISTLKPISGDLAVNPEIQFSFQSQVEPLYRELLSLLLPQNDGEIASQDNLELAKEQIESLQLVELNNFFREICLTRQPQSLETIDTRAAIIYPIILSDRLALLLSLPGKPLQVRIVPVTRPAFESEIGELRRTAVIRSRRTYLPPAQQLYDWLIRPLETEIKTASIETLVFVMDGALRNLPIAALRDRQQQKFLIESYQLALTPGLTLLAPQPIQRTDLATLLAGISQSRSGLAPLQYVEAEFQKIQSLLAARLLLNRNFTESQLRQALDTGSFPIVHLATHGQFSSRLNDTFILTWDTQLNIEDLAAILQASELQNEGAIELLVLSACETAAGDRRAALGLAGVAVRSGARSTLATLWSVNDEGTSALIGKFYEQLVQRRTTKAEALRQAQLALLKNRWYQHPFYWSPFVLVGNWL